MIPVLWDDRAKCDGQIYGARLLDNEGQATAGVGLWNRPLAGGTMHLDAQIQKEDNPTKATWPPSNCQPLLLEGIE